MKVPYVSLGTMPLPDDIKSIYVPDENTTYELHYTSDGTG